jgi:hypothetical protein
VYRFFVVAFLSVFTLMFYAVIYGSSDAGTSADLLGDFILTLFSLIFICSFCYMAEYRMRQLFWRKFREEEDDRIAH